MHSEETFLYSCQKSLRRFFCASIRRTVSRVSSFNKSFHAELGESSENGSPFLNQFTTVSKSYGKSLIHPTSPTKIRAPRPLSTPSPTLDLKQLNAEDHP